MDEKDEKDRMDHVRRLIEELREKEERLSRPAEELTLTDLQECLDLESVSMYTQETVQNLMADISLKPHGWAYYHLVIHALKLYQLNQVTKKDHFDPPSPPIEALSGRHLAEMARKAGLSWRQMESLLVGEGTGYALWKLMVFYEQLPGCLSTLWCSSVLIWYVWDLAEHRPDLLRERYQALYGQLTTL